MKDLLKDLNEAQRKAVEYIDGPSLVVAGAGSGKTRVLTYKIAYLLQHGMKPWNIMALTFTNKAANEMKERIGKLVGIDLAQHLYMGTFHSIFARILRVEAEHIGFNGNFTIYDEADSRSLLKSIVKEMGLDEKVYKPAMVHGKISRAKNKLMTADIYAADADIEVQNYRERLPSMDKVYQAYAQRCRQANAMDFDDLLLQTYMLFCDHDEIRRKYAERFSYILVDEYQDTNHAQQCIVEQLCRERLRVCAVGDDSQSIYGFRGANIDNILNFESRFANARLFKLEQNYRSTQNIVNAANSLIKHNRNQIPKEVFSENEQGEKLLYLPAYSDKEEAAIVIRHIKRIKRQDGCLYSDFAILYRTNSQSRSFEEELRRQNVPYRIFGGLSFFQRKEIKDVIAYFRLVCNPNDEEAFKRIVNYPTRGIGNATIQKIADCAQQNDTSFWNVISDPQGMGLNVNRGTMAKLEAFRQQMAAYIDKATVTEAYELGDSLVKEVGITADIFSGKAPEDIVRQENLLELLGGMQAFVEERKKSGMGEGMLLKDYLNDIALMTDLDSEESSDGPRVSLMTIHAAKGLEFPTVFVVGLEENIFPNAISASSLRELEEERRLLYVAITRAEKHCILTNAKNRFRYGKMEFDNPSRFIKDISPAYVVEEEDMENVDYRGGGYAGRMPWDGGGRNKMQRMPWDSESVSSQFKPDRKSSLPMGNFKHASSANVAKVSVPASSSSSVGLCEGAMIEHQRFGVGEVKKIEGVGENAKATVDFGTLGTKQLLLKFAKFTVIG